MAKFNLVVFQSSAFTTLAKNVVQTHDANERFLPWEFLDHRSLLSLRYTWWRVCTLKCRRMQITRWW